jgi:hypothetical protein
MAFRIPTRLLQAFIDHGLAPKHCRSLEVFIPSDGVLVLRSEVMVDREHVSKLAAAFAAIETALTDAAVKRDEDLTGGSS